jgi:hypothetical protein
MRWLAIPLLPLAALTISSAALADSVIAKEVALKAIAVFRKDPTSDLARTARALVVKFSRDSPDILIVFNPKNYPISELTAASEDEQSTLLTAFIVGNVDSQLSCGSKAKDDPYAGDLQMIRTYRQLQQKNRKLKLPAIEKMAEMEQPGELKRYLSSK